MHPDTLLTLLRDYDSTGLADWVLPEAHPLHDLVRAADNLAEGVRTLLNLLGQRP